MPEGWARALRGELIEARSAGVQPRRMNSRAVRAMAEAGVDISRQRSKHLDERRGVALDHVITVCDNAGEGCPLFPGNATITHVGFDVPPRLAIGAPSEEEAMSHCRRVRDETRSFVDRLPAELSPTRGSG